METYLLKYPNQAKDIRSGIGLHLVTDLKTARTSGWDFGLLWGGEFGRTNYSQGQLNPTGIIGPWFMHPRCFSIFADGRRGVKPGLILWRQHDELDYHWRKILTCPWFSRLRASLTSGPGSWEPIYKHAKAEDSDWTDISPGHRDKRLDCIEKFHPVPINHYPI